DTDVGFPGPDHHTAEETGQMRLAMGALAVLATIGGLIQIPEVTNALHNFLAPSFADSPSFEEIEPSAALSWIGLLVGAAVGATGIFVAHQLWVVHPERPARIRQQFAPLHRFFVNKWYFDEAIDFLVVRPALAIGRFADRTFERVVVDGLVNGTEDVISAGGRVVRLVQSGFVRGYALLLIAGFAGLALYFLIVSS
ncbi:MAG TPA: NADH-quinone oxidoreductase subunit L, partial [Solirubrobacterales bacterium]